MSLRGLYLDFQHKASTINDHDTLVVIGLPHALMIHYPMDGVFSKLWHLDSQKNVCLQIPIVIIPKSASQR